MIDSGVVGVLGSVHVVLSVAPWRIPKEAEVIAKLAPFATGMLILIGVFAVSALLLWGLYVVHRAVSNRPEGHSFGEDITPKD